MTLGVAETQGDLFDDATRFCAEALAGDSVYSALDCLRPGLDA